LGYDNKGEKKQNFLFKKNTPILSLIKIVVKYRIYIENPQILNDLISTFMEKFSSAVFTATRIGRSLSGTRKYFPMNGSLWSANRCT